jgi:hypothetical protein
MLASDRGVADHAAAELMGAGHTIVRCATTDQRAPCRGLEPGGGCPLDEYVDVAVLVPERGTDRIEHGAVCAARSRVPVVEVDSPDAAARTSTTLWRYVSVSDLLDECAVAAHDGGLHAQAVGDRLVALGLIAPEDLEGPHRTIAITVDRDVNRLQLTLELADTMRDREREVIRAGTQALREFDRRAAVIDVAVRRRRSITTTD